MEHVVNAFHGIFQCTLVAHIADIKLYLVCHFRHTGLEIVANVVLFLLIAAEDTNLTDVGAQETVKYCITETAGTSSDKEDLVFKY